jgi:hypothetical protein
MRVPVEKITVQMTRSEMFIARFIAEFRACENRGRATDMQMGGQPPEEIEYDGMLAEMAFGKQFNLYPDFSTHPRSGGADFRMRWGGETIKVDVKSTRLRNGCLLIRMNKRAIDSDLYVLAIVRGAEVDLVGHISAEAAMVDDNVEDKGHGKTWSIGQGQLEQFKVESE